MYNNEIITLQFGHYSNFIGCHWWNIQDSSFVYNSDEAPEINYDVLYREGENYQKEITFTPRLLLVDLKNSLGSLPLRSNLYDEKSIPDISENSSLWDTDKVQIQRELDFKKNEFLKDVDNEDQIMISENAVSLEKPIHKYNLDEKVNVWSDFNGVKFHSRSITIIDDYQHNNDNLPFDSYNQGSDLWKTDLFTEEWSDRCRLYMEECNSMQGFQVLFDCVDAFSGLSCSAMEYLQDEYPNKYVLAFPNIASFYHNSSRLKNYLRTVNSVFSYSSLIDLSSAFIPLSTKCNIWDEFDSPRTFDNLQYNKNLWYHSSALLAAFLDTVSINYRRRKNLIRLSDMMSSLSPCGRKLLTGTLRLPFPVYVDSSILESFEKLGNVFWTTVTPYGNVTIDSSILQELNVRGLSSHRLLPHTEKKATNMTFKCNNVEEMFMSYLNFCSSRSNKCISKINVMEMPLKIPSSFPDIFDSRITRIGCLNSTPLPPVFSVTEAPVFSGLHNCSISASSLLDNLYEKASKINLKQFHYFSTGGLEHLEYSESLETILTLRDNYI